ncbi:MAG: hypothetical protein R3E97_19915 [Candidatus Eisenbacteria bacterium]
MRSLVSGLVAFHLIAFASVSTGGPNENGTLVVHGCDLCFTTTDWPFFCDPTNWPQELLPTTCAEVNTYLEGANTVVWYVYAAFPPSASPRLSEVSFGIDLPELELVVVAWGSCADAFEATSNWPGSGSGTVLRWSVPQESTFVTAAYFAGYNYYGNPVSFALTPHPEVGGYFGDDSDPIVKDPIAQYGSLGWDGGEGSAPCPEEPTPTVRQSWGKTKWEIRSK